MVKYADYRPLIFLFVFSTLQNQVKPVLEKLRADTDFDVQFYAADALDGMWI